MKNIKLNNDVEIPIVGSGTNTYGKEGNQYSGALRGDTREIDWAIENGKMKPAVNQIESHIGKWNEELIAYHKGHDIATVAWSPLAGIDENARQVLEDIGNQYGKTYAQVVLRYQIERDVIVIPKSHNKDRQAQSLDIFDFELTANDRERIASL